MLLAREFSQSKETTAALIDFFAVRQLAASCVHILVHPPYNWNPDLRNVMGFSALDLAMRNRNAYLPVVWSLASTSTEVVRDPSEEHLSVTHILIKPPAEPLSHDQVIRICTLDFDNVEYTKNNICLFFELLRCTPTLLPQDLSSVKPQCCPECVAAGNTHSPLCLEEVTFNFDFPARYACWLWHRYRGESETPDKFDLPSLLECCRATIRKHIVPNLSNTDYAKALKSLQLPPRMVAFLAFREMWPVVDPKHAFDFRRGRSRNVPQIHPHPFILHAPFDDELLA
ncbi:hypothetical protein Aperf_G00000081002 [Anoplocephala perfoliata]